MTVHCFLNAIAGYDPHDGTVSKKPVEDYTAKIGKDIKGLKIGLPAEFFWRRHR